jgi:asparagine synthase (glutamine-hydrolysing)
MCGIAGKLNFDPSQPIDREVLAAMARVMAHRGPDGEGFHVSPGLGLVHRRLSIIDLAAGAQPLSNEDGNVWVTFNGEIYNFVEIRHELEQRGHRFRTLTDTEVIVHAYEEWGDAAVNRFRGMFAFAVWDEPRRRLLLVRDRVGVKPLHYSVTPAGVTFGSEIKALLEDPDVPRDWSPAAVDAYLTLQYVPCPDTMYSAIQKLPAGHFLVAEHGNVAIHQYWDLPFTGDGDPSREIEYLERLDALITESVGLRLVSDVSLGAFLSGGIDSTLIVDAMTRAAPSRVVTISVGFEERAYDETSHARAVAEHFHTEAHEQTVRPDILELLPKLAWHFDEPFADSSAVPTYHVAAAARQHVTVALSGDGGDELWGGYSRHEVEQWESIARQWIGPAGERVVGRLAGYLPLGLKGTRALRHLGLPPAQACALKHGYGLFERSDRAALYSRDFALHVRDADPFVGLRRAYRACPSADPLDRALYVDVKTSLVDDILTKVDRMSMAVSLEAREPLLDHRLLEFAATVPSALKIKSGRRKYLLRRLLENRVPKAIVDRPKQGFAAPIAEWLRGPLRPTVDALLLDGRLRDRGLFDPPVVRRLWREHREGAQNHRHRLWSLVMLELWFRQFMDGSGARRVGNGGVAA